MFSPNLGDAGENMASKSSNAVTTFYQCSECEHRSHSLEGATLHAVQAHQECNDDAETDDEFRKNILSDDEEEETIISLNSFNGAGGSGIREVWSIETTRELINSVKLFYDELITKSRPISLIWKDISELVELQTNGITAFHCETKWRQLVNDYKKFLITKGDKNKDRQHKTDFVDLMGAVVGSDILRGRDVSFSNEGYRSVRSRNPKVQESHQLTSALKSLLNGEDRSSDPSTLVKLISVLEKREASNLAFQKKVIEIEKEKLECMQKFVENKEKQSIRRYLLMKEYIYSQVKDKKRKLDQD